MLPTTVLLFVFPTTPEEPDADAPTSDEVLLLEPEEPVDPEALAPAEPAVAGPVDGL